MHDTAKAIGAAFLKQYSQAGQTIIEIGAFDFNGSIRSYAHPRAHYIGIDSSVGKGVDLVANNDLSLPIASKTADIVVATSVFEHATYFWITMLEVLRIAKDGGVIYVNAPSNGDYHRYPNDNWRFYPDSGKMLEKWGRQNGYDVRLIESFVADRASVHWNDFVAVFQVEPTVAPTRFLSDQFRCANVWRLDQSAPMRVRALSEDMLLLDQARAEIRALKKERADLLSALEGNSVSTERIEQRRFVQYMKQSGLDSTAAEARLRELEK